MNRGGCIIGVSLLLIGIVGCERHTPQEPATGPVPVTAVRAIEMTVPDERAYPATLSSVDAVTVDARVRGVLEERLFEEGAHVSAGQLLYRIQDDRYVAEVVQREAALSNAQTNLRFAEQEYARNKPLVSSGAISQQQWEQIERARGDALGRVAAADAELAKAQLELSYCSVVAPLSGRIGQTLIDVGNFVGPGSPSGSKLAHIVVLDPMYVMFSPSATEYASYAEALEQGEVPVLVRVRRENNTPPLEYLGTIDLLDPSASAATSTFTARAEFESPDRLALPGQFADVRVLVREIEHAVVIPTAALIVDHTKHFVRVVGADSKSVRREISIGAEFGPLTRVLDGVRPGEVVVVEASPLLKSGGEVKANVEPMERYIRAQEHTETGRKGGAG